VVCCGVSVRFISTLVVRVGVAYRYWELCGVGGRL